ncbi:MAG TPA: hypothetical protein VK961_20845 [Chthoniobacter sp.]|nr:hypothetical protein [Chthoniobacter sp.]
MAAKKKRDKEYYRQRLEIEFPAAYADFLAGKISSVMKAAQIVGIAHTPTCLSIMQREWKKADPKERVAFVAWIRSLAPAPKPSATASGPAPIVDADRKLLPSAKAEIKRIMDIRSLTSGDVVAELRLDKLDGSLGMALHRNTRISPDMIRELTDWVARHRAP